MRITVALILLIVITAYFSVGFYHPDEHFQVLELLNLKITGIYHPHIFNWDFTEKMRSWVQPGFYLLIAKIVLPNPFVLAFILRLFQGLLGLFALKKLSEVFFTEKKDQEQSLIFAICTWFTPFILVRTSSESLSASLFFLGTALFLKPKNINFFTLAGFLWGLSFCVRFQMGVVIFAGVLWSLIFNRKTKTFYALFALAFLFALTLGFLVDWWGHQESTFTVWNYFKQNFILKRANDFGVKPFYFYIPHIFIKGVPPLSLVFIFGVAAYWWKYKKDFFTFITLIFFIVHSLIAHKELRFLNLIYLIAPFMIYRLLAPIKIKKWYWPILAWNFVMLIYLALTPAHSPVRAYQYLAKNMPEVKSLYTPSTDGQKLELSLIFYQKNLIQTIPFNLAATTENELNAYRNIITTKYQEKLLLEKYPFCHPQFSLFPEWSYQFNYFNWISRSSLWIIWKCQQQ
jgi:phosphatidylinositol glycan class B